MLLTLLVYAYCCGVRSSRQIEQRCATDVAFRVLCAQDVPDHTTIVRFHSACQDAFGDLFTQVLLIAAQSGLAWFGTVAIDGTKIPANASIDANRGQQWFEQQVHGMVADAKAVDAGEGCLPGSDGGPTERMPAWVASGSARRERIRAAAAQVDHQLANGDREQSAREEAGLARRRRSAAGLPIVERIPEGPHRLAVAHAHLAREIAMHQAKLDRYVQLIAAGKKPMGRPPVAMHDNTRVQRAHRVVEAARNASDIKCPAPMMHAAQAAAVRCFNATGRPEHRIGTVLADASYASDAAPGPGRVIDLGKRRGHAGAASDSAPLNRPPQDATAREFMAYRLRTTDGHALYKRRSATVEPVIGNLKKILNRFSRRG